MRTVSILLLVCIAPTCSAAETTGDEKEQTHTIVLHRPWKVGDVYALKRHIRTTAKEVCTVRATTETFKKTTLYLEAKASIVQKVLKVDGNGIPVKVHFKSLVVRNSPKKRFRPSVFHGKVLTVSFDREVKFENLTFDTAIVLRWSYGG